MDYKSAQKYWDEKEKTADKLEDDKLKEIIYEFINKHKTCCLATGYDTFIRCTPIEYNFINEYFYLISEGGHKFDGIEKNKNVCIGIYEEYVNFADCHGLQVIGEVEIIDPTSKEYEEIFAIKHISMEALKRINHPMHLLKITPKEYDILSSDFKKMGLNTFRGKLIVK